MIQLQAERGIVTVRRGRVYFTPSISGGGGSDGGGGTTNTTNVSTDPWLTKQNELKYNQLNEAVNMTGGYPSYLAFNPFALPTSEESGIVGQIGEVGKGQGELGAMETEGLAEMTKLGDPSAALEKASGLYEQYGAPIVKNAASLRGQNRAGAVPEALAGGFAQMALPIIQASQGHAASLANTKMKLGGELPGRKIAGLETSLRAAGSDRQALSAEYMRPLMSVANLIGGLPSGGGQTTGYQTGQNQTQQGDVNWVTDVGVPLLSSALSAYLRG